jgi:16S rRNA (uracil1498-N3)-methyltransferase
MARFSIGSECIRNGTAILSGEELHHMKRVLRLRPGDRVTLFDDQGREHVGVIRSYHPREGEVEILNSYEARRESPLNIALAQSLGKGDKMDWIIEKATELGVGRILPFVSLFSVPRYSSDKASARMARWSRIAVSAAKQSGRTRVPEICDLVSFEELVRHSPASDLKLIFWERAESSALHELKDRKAPLRSVLLAIGPEGGFSDEEAALASSEGFQSVRLGARILRTETAAVAAVSIVQFLHGDLGSGA